MNFVKEVIRFISIQFHPNNIVAQLLERPHFRRQKKKIFTRSKLFIGKVFTFI